MSKSRKEKRRRESARGQVLFGDSSLYSSSSSPAIASDGLTVARGVGRVSRGRSVRGRGTLTHSGDGGSPLLLLLFDLLLLLFLLFGEDIAGFLSLEFSQRNWRKRSACKSRLSIEAAVCRERERLTEEISKSDAELVEVAVLFPKRADERCNRRPTTTDECATVSNREAYTAEPRWRQTNLHLQVRERLLKEICRVLGNESSVSGRRGDGRIERHLDVASLHETEKASKYKGSRFET